MIPPLAIGMHERDNVAIVADDGGLPAGTVLASGLALRGKLPQGHKVALIDIAAGEPVRRCDVTIGNARANIAAGSWVHERVLEMRAASRSVRCSTLPVAERKPGRSGTAGCTTCWCGSIQALAVAEAASASRRAAVRCRPVAKRKAVV